MSEVLIRPCCAVQPGVDWLSAPAGPMPFVCSRPDGHPSNHHEALLDDVQLAEWPVLEGDAK